MSAHPRRLVLLVQVALLAITAALTGSWAGSAASQSATATPTPTTEAALNGSPPVAAALAQAGIRQPTAAPVTFVFPTPLPAPDSAWRPPLYSVPWALSPYDHFYFTRPITADQVNWPLPDYRFGGVFFDDVVHTGVDIPAARGTAVHATGAGKITWAGTGLYALKKDADDPYGLAIAIRHDFGYNGETLYTIYGHLDKIFVELGQRVQEGDLIGLAGETGNVTGPHLHYEVRIGKNNYYGAVNPELWIAPPQGWGVLAARVMSTGGATLKSHEVHVRSYTTGQRWSVKTYGKNITNTDAYYRENLVLGDLPAGKYEIWVPYFGVIYNLDVEIRPGMISYFTFRGQNGFHTGAPPLPGSDFVPPAVSIP